MKAKTNLKTVKLNKDWQHPAGTLKLKGTKITVDKALYKKLLKDGFIGNKKNHLNK